MNEESKLTAVTPEQIPDHMVKDQDILIIDDIYDSGTLINLVIKRIQAIGARSIESCILLHKRNPSNLKYNYHAKYLGFTVPNKFVIGYGMDYNERCRELPHVCVINELGVDKYKVS